MNWTSEQREIFTTYIQSGDWMSFMAYFDISYEEVMLGVLDEEMTLQQYIEYGPPEAVKEIKAYYTEKGAVVAFGINGLTLYNHENIAPFQPTEKKMRNFTLKERAFICRLAHQYLETHEITAEEIKRALLEV